MPSGRSARGRRSASEDAGARQDGGAGPWVEVLDAGGTVLDAGGPVLDAGGPVRRPAPLPAGLRRVVGGLAVLVLLGGGVLFLRYWSAERDARQAVDLSASLGLVSSSTSRPGGEVRFFLLVRNDGALPVSVTSVDGAEPGLLLRMFDDGVRRVASGTEVEIPLSVQVTCAERAAAVGSAVEAEIGVRREDGAAASRRVALRPAATVRDVAATVCAVRPDLRGHELSGPALRLPADG